MSTAGVGIGGFDASVHVVKGKPEETRALRIRKARAAVEYFARELDLAGEQVEKTTTKRDEYLERLKSWVAEVKHEVVVAKEDYAASGQRLADAQRQLAELEGGGN